MKKLYEVNIEATVYAMAETPEGAIDAIREEASLMDLGLFDTATAEKCDYGGILREWANSQPYGDNKEGLTVSQWRDIMVNRAKMDAERAEWERRQIKLFQEGSHAQG